MSLPTSGIIAALAVSTFFIAGCQDDSTAKTSTTAPSSTIPERDREQSDRPGSRNAVSQPPSPARDVPTGSLTNPPDTLPSRSEQTAKSVTGLADDPATVQRNREAAAGHAPDNTGVNARDRNVDAVTPMDQAENSTDIGITAGIRRALISESRFSLTAKNIKIITSDGHVTLRGVVASLAESGDIARLASTVQGVREVTNALEVAP